VPQTAPPIDGLVVSLPADGFGAGSGAGAGAGAGADGGVGAPQAVIASKISHLVVIARSYSGPEMGATVAAC